MNLMKERVAVMSKNKYVLHLSVKIVQKLASYNKKSSQVYFRFAWGHNGEGASVYDDEKGILNSFNMVMENAKNHSQLNNEHAALGP